MKDLNYQYTNNWFDVYARSVWSELIPQVNPTNILEIGSYEGASSCYLIQSLAEYKPIELHCIDTWQGGVEHHDLQTDMRSVEERFHHNTRLTIDKSKYPVDLITHKSCSDLALAKLLANGKEGYFDFIYIDGSHQAPDVLCDAVLAFKLLRINGVMVFDDYLWQEKLPYGVDLIRCPKAAIDAFTNIFCRKINIITAPLYQLYVQKISN